MMRLLRRDREESGAAAVEFALVAPIMISLMFGIIEFGYYFNFKTTVTNYAMVAARGYAINPGAQPDNTADRKSLAATALGVPASAITNDPKGSIDCTVTANSGKNFTVTVQVKRRTLTGFPKQEFTYSGKGLGQCA